MGDCEVSCGTWEVRGEECEVGARGAAMKAGPGAQRKVWPRIHGPETKGTHLTRPRLVS
jgi:hypothetical protein